MLLENLSIGHYHRENTGCTAFLFDQPTTCAYYLCGMAPATRDISLLDRGNLVSQVHGLCLSGGSAFGLAASGGVMDYLQARGVGLQTPNAIVPIVPSAAIYDLKPDINPPTAEEGFLACENAVRGERSIGRIGAGAGASVGKLFADAKSTAAGFGHGVAHLSSGVIVEAFAVVNCVGDVINERGEIIAGARDADGNFIGSKARLLLGESYRDKLIENTTLVAIFTNAGLSQSRCYRLAKMGSSGLSLSQSPSMTMFDGDIVFGASLGDLDADDIVLGAMAEEAVRLAVVSTVL